MIGTSQERLDELDRMYPVWEEDTLWTRFEKNASRFKDRPFILYNDQEITYGQALAEVNCLALCCYKAGIRQGMHIGVMLYNSPEFVFLTFALAKIGAVKVHVNMRLSDQEKLFILENADCSYAFCHSLKKLPVGIGNLAGLHQCIILHVTLRSQLPPKCMSWRRFRALGHGSEGSKLPEVPRDPMQPVDIMYTSGSTSFPKGVLLTSDMLLRSSFGTCRTRRMEIGRRMLVTIPLYHIFGYLEGMLALIWVGGTMLLLSGKVQGDAMMEVLTKGRANDIIGVPIAIMRLLEEGNPTPEQLPELHAGYWASTCPDWVWTEAGKRLGIEDITTGYGMTECGSTTTIMPVGEPLERLKRCQGKRKEAGAAGKDGRLLEIKVVSPDTGAECLPGQTGELYCRGLTVTPGYYKCPDKDAESFDLEGWFATGDLCSVDREGYLTFLGRKNDAYKINGENVSPQFINVTLGRCPYVKAVETVGVADKTYGGIGVSYVELGEDNAQKRKQLEEYMKENLAGFEIPKYIVVSRSAQWPRTSAGKIRTETLRKNAAAEIARYQRDEDGHHGKEIVWISQ